MLSQKDNLKAIFGQYCDWQSHNNRSTQIGIYSIALIGLGVALRRVRPFTMFIKPQDVPNFYIKKQMEITGKVTRIEPNEAVLMVKHRPVIQIPFVHQKNHALPIKIANVKINNLGISWLQSIVSGNEVTFVPLTKCSNYILCKINLKQEHPQKKFHIIDLGETLCSVGFGHYVEYPVKVNDIMHQIYIDRLKHAETCYVKQEMGLKYYIEPTKNLVMSILHILSQYSFMKIFKLNQLRLVEYGKGDKISRPKDVQNKLSKYWNVNA